MACAVLAAAGSIAAPSAIAKVFITSAAIVVSNADIEVDGVLNTDPGPTGNWGPEAFVKYTEPDFGAVWTSSATGTPEGNLEVGVKVGYLDQYKTGWARATTTLNQFVQNEDPDPVDNVTFQYHIDPGELLFKVQPPFGIGKDDMTLRVGVQLYLYRGNVVDTLLLDELVLTSGDGKGAYTISGSAGGQALIDDVIDDNSQFGVTTKAVDGTVSFKLGAFEVVHLFYGLVAMAEVNDLIDWGYGFSARLGDPFSVGGGGSLTFVTQDPVAMPLPSTPALAALGLLAAGLLQRRRQA